MLNSRFIQAFFALSPFIVFVFGLIAFVAVFFSAASAPMDNTSFENDLLAFFISYFLFVLLVLFLSILSLIYYIIHIIKNPQLSSENNMKLIWIIIVLLASSIGILVYWIVQILMKNPKPYIEQ